MNYPRYRLPQWEFQPRRSGRNDALTAENQKFIQDKITQDFGPKVMHKGVETYESSSLLKVPQIEPTVWKHGMHRCGTIAKKIGHYPLWLKDGRKINTTVLQIVDNHVVKFIPAGEYNPTQRKPNKSYRRTACILVGAEADDPSKFTANYIGLFKGSGVMPCNKLFRFHVSPRAALPPGTPLNVCHYRVGDYVDVRGKT